MLPRPRPRPLRRRKLLLLLLFIIPRGWLNRVGRVAVERVGADEVEEDAGVDFLFFSASICAHILASSASSAIVAKAKSRDENPSRGLFLSLNVKRQFRGKFLKILCPKYTS